MRYLLLVVLLAGCAATPAPQARCLMAAYNDAHGENFRTPSVGYANLEGAYGKARYTGSCRVIQILIRPDAPAIALHHELAHHITREREGCGNNLWAVGEDPTHGKLWQAEFDRLKSLRCDEGLDFSL